ncbi:hypothetical protein Moror_5936 [Moniliophthora roreri MCA 2997]|uniref:Uncharacterized protein n=1 Tax=Moniliophthora roreri (strain MCA 2997) TaxID=1381753 RepID=V2WYW3_MONRO|nr:hypothetical protein Moror_5936 [Moniliophthora roreri MCA 2997]
MMPIFFLLSEGEGNMLFDRPKETEYTYVDDRYPSSQNLKIMNSETLPHLSHAGKMRMNCLMRWYLFPLVPSSHLEPYMVPSLTLLSHTSTAVLACIPSSLMIPGHRRVIPTSPSPPFRSHHLGRVYKFSIALPLSFSPVVFSTHSHTRTHTHIAFVLGEVFCAKAEETGVKMGVRQGEGEGRMNLERFPQSFRNFVSRLMYHRI